MPVLRPCLFLERGINGQKMIKPRPYDEALARAGKQLVSQLVILLKTSHIHDLSNEALTQPVENCLKTLHLLFSEGGDPILTLYGEVLVLGDIVGDSIYYFVGRKGARFFVKIFGRFAGVDTDHFIALENHFKKHAGKTIFFSKTQALGGAILAAAGASKMSYWKFLLYNILGSSIKIMALVVLGYYFGKSYNNINNGLNIAGLVSVVLLIFITVIYLRRKKKKS